VHIAPQHEGRHSRVQRSYRNPDQTSTSDRPPARKNGDVFQKNANGHVAVQADAVDPKSRVVRQKEMA
jgi:hypothetical protein